ncbi:hypothetical protein F5B20DRAFT_102621 [Whalleya microplaca]|nr:hypothetical protein F5B20DRAFT_102621 [Whalleya microplaca]
MAPRPPPLAKLIYQGFHSGFQWETQGTKELDQEAHVVKHHYRSLLHHQHSSHIARVIFKGLETDRKDVTSEALAKLYDHAAENVDLCGRMSPEEFFACAKDSWAWSSNFTNEAFWAFTYKAFHARAIFLATTEVQDGKEPHYRPLTHAIDRFRENFFDCWREDYPNLGKNPNQEDLEQVRELNSYVAETVAKYFPFNLTDEDGEGDGTDKVLVRLLPEETKETMKDVDMMNAGQSGSINDESEQMIAGSSWYYDFGNKARFGFDDKYKAERDLDSEGEDDGKAAKMGIMGVGNVPDGDGDGDGDGDDDDVAMMDVDAPCNDLSLDGLNLASA